MYMSSSGGAKPPEPPLGPDGKPISTPNGSGGNVDHPKPSQEKQNTGVGEPKSSVVQGVAPASGQAASGEHVNAQEKKLAPPPPPPKSNKPRARSAPSKNNKGAAAQQPRGRNKTRRPLTPLPSAAAGAAPPLQQQPAPTAAATVIPAPSAEELKKLLKPWSDFFNGQNTVSQESQNLQELNVHLKKIAAGTQVDLKGLMTTLEKFEPPYKGYTIQQAEAIIQLRAITDPNASAAIKAKDQERLEHFLRPIRAEEAARAAAAEQQRQKELAIEAEIKRTAAVIVEEGQKRTDKAVEAAIAEERRRVAQASSKKEDKKTAGDKPGEPQPQPQKTQDQTANSQASALEKAKAAATEAQRQPAPSKPNPAKQHQTPLRDIHNARAAAQASQSKMHTPGPITTAKYQELINSIVTEITNKSDAESAQYFANTTAKKHSILTKPGEPTQSALTVEIKNEGLNRIDQIQNKLDEKTGEVQVSISNPCSDQSIYALLYSQAAFMPLTSDPSPSPNFQTLVRLREAAIERGFDLKLDDQTHKQLMSDQSALGKHYQQICDMSQQDYLKYKNLNSEKGLGQPFSNKPDLQSTPLRSAPK